MNRENIRRYYIKKVINVAKVKYIGYLLEKYYFSKK